eukprot:GFYU01007610.1.p1 GENE.GFYU01007610.1~~GFYU01007610.1.p1  ORF type:complete len:494 (-),score=189.23 GFYU01007610.1:23-1504(-)
MGHPELITKKNDTALSLAAISGCGECVEMLLDAGANPNKHGPQGLNALHVVSSYGLYKTVSVLIKSGALVNARTFQNQLAPIHLAAIGQAEEEVPPRIAERLKAEGLQNHTKTVAVLLLGKADAASVDSNYTTALHYAAIRGDVEMGRLLLKTEIEVDAQDKFYRTPLHCAASAGKSEFIRLLLSEGALTNERDDRRLAPLHYAALYNHGKAVHALLDGQSLLSPKDESGATPLHLAALNGMAASLEALLDRGAVADAIMDTGVTALHIACVRGAEACVDLLLKREADLYRPAPNQMNALQMCLTRSSKQPNLVTILKKHGVSEEEITQNKEEVDEKLSDLVKEKMNAQFGSLMGQDTAQLFNDLGGFEDNGDGKGKPQGKNVPPTLETEHGPIPPFLPTMDLSGLGLGDIGSGTIEEVASDMLRTQLDEDILGVKADPSEQDQMASKLEEEIRQYMKEQQKNAEENSKKQQEKKASQDGGAGAGTEGKKDEL